MTELDGSFLNPNCALDHLAAAPSLLVCSDFDGTICELGTDAYAVRPHPDAVRALEELAQCPNTTVAILSGRHLDGLRTVSQFDDPFILVGSHGAEASEGGPEITAEDAAFLARIQTQLENIATGNEPAFVEVKPYQRVLHVAELAAADPDRAEALLEQARALPSEGRPVTPGHNIVEFSALDISKGTWLEAAKRDYAVTLFAGDDVTDESALRVLNRNRPADGTGDVGIRIARAGAHSAPETAAEYRLNSVDEMAEFLLNLSERRRSAQARTE